MTATLPDRLLAAADSYDEKGVNVGDLLREAAAALSGREAVAWLHDVVQDDGEPDQALSFSRESFPLDGVGGFRSVKVTPLYTTPQPGDGWRPIAEAPKDGRYVLLVHETSGGRPYAGMWSYDDKQWADERGCIRIPTHWMPLPAAPSAKGVANG